MVCIHESYSLTFQVAINSLYFQGSSISSMMSTWIMRGRIASRKTDRSLTCLLTTWRVGNISPVLHPFFANSLRDQVRRNCCLLRINYFCTPQILVWIYDVLRLSLFSYVRFQLSATRMPAIRTDDSEYNDSSDTPSKAWKRRKTIDHVSQAHRRQSQSQTEECIISSEGAIISSDSIQLTSVHTPQSKFVGPITVLGVTLRPTVAFDTFWRFAAERQAIDDRRRAGEPAP